LVEFQDALLRLDPVLQNEVYRYLVIWAADVEALARQLVPVKTGYLRSTIYAVVRDWSVNIGAEATYAYFVEAGTRNMAAKPYLFPAVQQYLPQLEQIILAAIESAKAEAGLT
jgi:HK97 gp10 family phage protein